MLKQLSTATFRCRLWPSVWLVVVGLAIASCSFRTSSTTSDNSNAESGTPEPVSSSSPPFKSIDAPVVSNSTSSADTGVDPDDSPVESNAKKSNPKESNPKESNQTSTTDSVDSAASDIIEGTASFVLPSGNIYCLTYDQVLRCEMKSLLNPMPSQPDTCDLDWGGGVILMADGPTEVLCAGDTVAGNYDTLAYGTTWRNGLFECMSETVGLTCKNANAQGFFLSRERWELF